MKWIKIEIWIRTMELVYIWFWFLRLVWENDRNVLLGLNRRIYQLKMLLTVRFAIFIISFDFDLVIKFWFIFLWNVFWEWSFTLKIVIIQSILSPVYVAFINVTYLWNDLRYKITVVEIYICIDWCLAFSLSLFYWKFNISR